MKKSFSEKKTKPVPIRVCAAFLLTLMLLGASTAAGAAAAPDETEIPVVTSDGSVITRPWYITVDGEKTVLVESRKAACETLQNVVKKYENEESCLLDVEIMEDTGAEQMILKNGDSIPEIMTVEEAEKALTGEDGGESLLTVVTTEERQESEEIEYETVYRTEPDMYVGQTAVENPGEKGKKEVTRKIVKENGRTVSEEVTEEKVIEEPEKEVILAGVKGSDSGDIRRGDEALSYDENGVYSRLDTPVCGGRITSEFGPRWGRLHRGIDIAVPTGTDIIAADGGKVYFSGWSGGYGNMVRIDHGNGMQTYYAHCSSLLVDKGDTVERGQKIAVSGSTGNSTGPHLHFEVIINRTCVDPVDFID